MIFSAAYADAVAEHYRQLISSSLVTSSDTFLQSGWYKLKSRDTADGFDLSNSNIAGSYEFDNIGDIWHPFVTGGFGFSKITQKSVNIDSKNLGALKLDSRNLKLGGGVNYYPSDNLNLTLAANGMWILSDGDYTGADISMNKYFGKESDTRLFELLGNAKYHFEIDGFKPYAELTLRYLDVNYDFNLPATNGWDVNLSVGAYSPTLTTWMNLPVRSQFYVGATLLDKELSGLSGFRYAYHSGASLLWKVGPMIHIFNDALKEAELAVSIQGTKGSNHLSGWKAGIGFTISKF